MIHVSQAPTSTLSPDVFLTFSHLEVKSGFVRDSEKVDKQKSPTWWFKPWPYFGMVSSRDTFGRGEVKWPTQRIGVHGGWITWNMFFSLNRICTLRSQQMILEEKNKNQVIQSAWPFYPLVGGHQQPFQKGHVNSPSPKRSRLESPGKDVLKLLVKSLASSNKHCKQPMFEIPVVFCLIYATRTIF